MANPLFKALGEVLTKQLIPEEVAGAAAKEGAEAAAKTTAKLPEWVLSGKPRPGSAVSIEPVMPKVEPTPALKAPTTAAPALPRMKVKLPEPQPLKPTTRTPQLSPEHAEHAAKMEVSPEYLKRIDDLGGGRRVTHEETWARAINAKPMTIEELSSWTPNKPVNEVHVARAGLLRQELWDRYFEAMQGGDDQAAMELERAIEIVEPGYNVLTATPGRATEFQKVFSEFDAVQNRVRQLRAANIPYPQVRDEINALLQELRDARGEQKPGKDTASLLDRIESYATAAKLTSPVTHAINTISNSLTFAQRGVEKYVTSAVLQAGGKPIEAEAMRMYAWGTRQGFVDGTRKFLDALTTETPGAGSKIEVRPEGGKPLPMPLRVLSPFRWLEAADNFWKAVIHDSELHTKAYTQATREGLQGPQLAQRVGWLVENPPEPWKSDAWQTALEYTYTDDPGRLVNALRKLQDLPGGKLLIPFIRTPANILRFQARRSPLGFISAKNVADWKAGGVKRAEVMGRYITGVGLSAAALAVVTNGTVTGAYPSDPSERALWVAENRKPWSILINGHWLSFDRVQPMGLYLSQVAALSEAIKNDDFNEADTLTQRLAYQFLRGPMDVSFLQGMSALLDAISDPERSASKFGQLILTGFIPNVLRDVRLQTDSTQRKPENITEAIENMLPGLSQEVMPNVSVIGHVMESEEDRLVRAFKQTAPSIVDQNTAFLREIKWSPIPPSLKLRVRGIEKEIEGPNREAYMKEMGEVTLAAIQTCMNNPQIAPLDAPMKRRVVARVVEAARLPVTRKYQALLGLYGPEIQREMQMKGQP